MRKLTTEELARAEIELNALVTQARKQLDEWKVSLLRWADQIKVFDYKQIVDTEASERLQAEVSLWITEIKLEIVSTNEMGLVGREINAVYDMPDNFVKFITSPPDGVEMPQELRDALKGSHVVEARPAAKMEVMPEYRKRHGDA